MIAHRHLFLVLIFLTFIGCDGPKPELEPPAQKPALAEPAPPIVMPHPGFADMVEKTRPAVVNIFTKTNVQSNRFFEKQGKKLIPKERLADSLGSGFLIDKDGFVLTNYHVIKGATKIEVRLLDERRFKAQVVGEDPKTDVALLKLEAAKDLPVVPLGDSEKLRVGDWVVAIGNPLGLTSTVTAGIASAKGREDIPLSGDLRYQDFIQTDASINLGNSGGPLVDVDGNVVGINTAVTASAQGIGFAIPVNMVKEMLPRLKEGGRLKRAWLGIFVDEVPSALRTQIELPDKGGALIKGIVKGGPAHKATLRPGDVVLTLGTERVEDDDQLAWIAGNHKAGESIPVEIRRGTETLTLSVTLGVLPD